MGLTIEQLKQLSREFLEAEIDGETFVTGLADSFATNADADIAAKWLAEQILIVR